MTNPITKLIERIQKKRLAYRRCLLGENGQPTVDADIVLKDLARFCYAHKAGIVRSPITGTVDPVASALVQGRHEVWLRICEHLHLDDSYLTNAREERDND